MSRVLRVAESKPQVYRAKLFRTGGSQAVRLPRQCRLSGTEVLVRRMGSAVILSPLPDSHSEALRALLLGSPRRLIRRAPQGRLERPEIDL
jgi:antitoxin VapB